MYFEFEWDEQKAKTNFQKHGISFKDAKTVFQDIFAYIFYDQWHSNDEDREIIIGHDSKNRLLLVCFTERNQKVRIISSRLATKKERQNYEKNIKF